DVPSREWVSECLNKELNTSGASALFNIPNDADDTSTAVALQLIRKQLSDKYTDDPFFNNSHNFEIDLPALMLASSYRDIGRLDKYEDGRDSWKGKNSGAFLTWYRDETMPIFSSPQKGIIPLGKNNVDAVVNANVVFALGLAGKKDVPGYKESIKLLNRAIEERTWPRCGLYYPQYVIFPYVVSRAFRDGGNNGLKTGMKTLLDDLLTIQKEYGDKKSSHKGAFPGGEDKTDYLATALGVTSLLNIGIDIAREEGKLIPYNKAIKDGIYYLLKNRKKYKVKNFDTVGRDKLSEKISGYTWDCGLFFSASFWDLAHWRSEAYTNAMVLEAFTKYLLGYEFGGVTIMHGRRLHIKSYRTNDSGFELDVK
ncbi:hypothetical protein KAJ27_21135, partial [bacterium]|nr:hypothetical protein [bacterium]